MTGTNLQDRVTEWAQEHRRWMTQMLACGHHVSHYSQRRGECVSCAAAPAAPTTNLNQDSAAYDCDDVFGDDRHEQEDTDEELLRPVYMPNGEVGYFGFNGGGRATDAQKAKVRSLLNENAGHPTVEAIRRRMNELRESGERIEKCDVIPVLRWFGRGNADPQRSN
jgi:hypothetical protein